MHDNPNTPKTSPARSGKLIALTLLVLGGLIILAAAYYIAGKSPLHPTTEPTTTEPTTELSITQPQTPTPQPTPHLPDDHHTQETSVTVSADTLLTALQSRGWRPTTEPSRINLGPGSIQLHARLSKNQHTTNLTLFQLTDLYATQDIIDQTKAPAETIVFGTTVARITPDDPSQQSTRATQQLAKILREIKSIANHI